VAGYARKLRKQHDPLLKKLERAAEPILQEKYNWEKIKSHVKDIIFINSDNDPWGCNDAEGRFMFDLLGGTLIIKHGEGHMGSDMFHQPYKEFPLLVKLIESF
jgi:predicted alpha/beta hydrolase family esterase